MTITTKTFVGFSYQKGGKVWVEAVPTHGLQTEDVLRCFPPTLAWFILFAPSRNQARKQMYRLMIEPTGKGYNHYPRPPRLT